MDKREKNREYQARYRAKHPDRIRKKNQEWYYKDVEKTREYHREYRKQHKDKINENKREYMREYMREYRKRKKAAQND